MSFDKYHPFVSEKLPYAFDALVPNISECTMHFHHDKHYMGYIDKLNKLLEEKPYMQDIPLETLTKMEDDAIRNNAGGVYNHELYFRSLTPDYQKPAGRIAQQIEKDFGSLEALEKKLTEAGMGIIGSGWVWLVENQRGNLEILTTKNQDTINFDKYNPLMNIDVWEHAYYLDRQNRRDKYLNAVLKKANWLNAQNNMRKV